MQTNTYIYGDKQTLERVLIAIHLMHNKYESNYPLNFMSKWHHHIKSQTDSDYLAHVDFDDSWTDVLDDPEQFNSDWESLTKTDTKPDKFVVEIDEDGNPVDSAKEPFKSTTDGQYMIPESEDEQSVMIRRDGLGRPLKDASGNHITNNQEIDESTIDSLPEEGVWVEETKIYKFDGKLWGCIQGHNRMHYHPSETPALFNEIPNDFSGGYPVWQQPTGTHDAYNTGDIVLYLDKNGDPWISKINANTTVPDGDEPWNRYWEPYS